MKKRFFSLFLALVLALGLVSPALAAVPAVSEEEAAQILAALDIMSGNEDGDLMLGRTMTRAELVKLTMAASPLKDSVGESTTVSPYPDVPYTHWAAPAVQAAVAAGYVKGYLDGTFRPGNTVTLAEAVTFALRLLGYESTDFTGAYPSGQMALYRTLDLDKGVSANTNSAPVTRRDAMYLFYNLLTARTKGGQVYCTTLGYPLTAGGELDRVAILNSAMDGPVVCAPGWEGSVPFSLEHATVFRAGKAAALADLQTLDLIYYSKSMRTIWAYTEQVTGSIQSVQPAASPTSVTVAGQTLNIETAEAALALSDLGTYQPGDVVTLLLGRSGGVAAVVDSTRLESSAMVCGMVTGTGKASYPDGKGGTQTRRTITMVTTAGNTVTYPSADSTALEPGDLAQAFVKNGEMVIRHLTTSTFTGAVRSDGSTAGRYPLASDVEILDTYGTDGVMRIYPARLAGTRLQEGAVRYYQTNSAGEITRLILNDVTGDLHRYGVLTQVSEVSGRNPLTGTFFLQSAYVYDLGGTPGAYQSSTTLFGAHVGPFKLVMKGGEVYRMKNLTEVKITALGDGAAQVENQSYKLADNTLYYEVRGGDYYLTDAEHLTNGRYRLTGWYDKLPSEGGRIRVVVGY